jgi:hypothetical protein
MSLYQSLAVVAALNGKIFVCGTLTPADEDVEVVTGLSIVDFCGVSLAEAPTVLHNQSSAAPGSTAGTVNVLSFRPTSSSNPTPIVSTTEVAVTWWAVGT